MSTVTTYTYTPSLLPFFYLEWEGYETPVRDLYDRPVEFGEEQTADEVEVLPHSK